jgi:uncharacterized protein YecE (DUF72 family)
LRLVFFLREFAYKTIVSDSVSGYVYNQIFSPNVNFEECVIMLSIVKLFTGTSGWGYSSRRGIFYLEKLEQRQWLSYYSHVFDYVEIDSTFYQIPTKNMVKLWNARTSSKFRFSAKFPRVITHEKRFQGCQKELELFYEAMEPLKDKLLTLLIQFPPTFKIKEGMEALRQYGFFFDDSFRYAIEVRHSSWFSDLAYNVFKNNRICLVWNQLDIVQTPPVVTTDFVYLRFIGDRSISERHFGTILKDRALEMSGWAERLKKIQQDEHDVRTAMVAANNHYAGFGPETSNIFREMLGLHRVEWGSQIEIPEMEMVELENMTSYEERKNTTKQTSLTDFI